MAGLPKPNENDVLYKALDVFRDRCCMALRDRIAEGGDYDDEFACNWNGVLREVMADPRYWLDRVYVTDKKLMPGQ